jgi:type I restriction enzyme R subunit
MQMTPEQHAREKIDSLLIAAGWVLQNNSDFDRNAAEGVVVREFSLPNGPCDYLLFVGGKAAGVIEAKKLGSTLSGVAEQSAKYVAKLPAHLARWSDQLILHYESTGEESFFCDKRDPKSRSRRVFAFHQPHTLHTWLKETDTLRSRLQQMPPLDGSGLRDCQIEAVHGLDGSLYRDKPRALIQMATGAGKTFTACTFSWRLLKFAKAKRILFLVDRNNLGDQTLKEYQNYDPPGSGRKFDKTYIVQHLHSNRIDPDAKVVITTIQRLYAMLRGEELDESAEESSAFETWTNEEGELRPVAYNPAIPIEHFDFIVTDECHRSIYGVWRQVLEYFDAHLIGLTATPSSHTLGFFKQNLVSEYPYEQSIVDGVNVGFEVFRIRTLVSERGGTVNSDYHVPVRDRRTRAIRYKQLDGDIEYAKQQLDNTVTVPNQIRAVLQCYKDKLFTELFPGRTGEWVPKTLIFAKDDNHAEEIVHAVREVFGQGNDFAKKITYQTTEKPKELIAAFRVDPFPRIAVTVDMIATGTDIKPVECLIFMRDVKSEGYFEQMKGRGVRTLKDADLRQVTPDAQTKTRFVIIDAVGVTEGKKTISQPLERKRAMPFDKLIDQIAQGRRDFDAISSLAGRLAALDRQIDDEDRQRIEGLGVAGGTSLKEISGALLRSISPDVITSEVVARHGSTEAATEAQVQAIEEELKDRACKPIDNASLRSLVKIIKQKADIVIDEGTVDQVTSAGYDLKQAEMRTTSFREFIEKNKNELLALEILYSQPYPKRRLTYASIRELAQRLTDPPYHLTTADVWQAYHRLEASLVRGAPSDKVLTDIISLVRFATGETDLLEPYATRVEQRFNLWIGRQVKAGRNFDEEQMNWLKAIKDYLVANVEIAPGDLMRDQPFRAWGGVIAARNLFGAELNGLLDELSEALAA